MLRTMADAAMQRKFSEALDVLVGQIQQDRSVLAAILCGSLSHDQVWAKSDIDLLLVTIDDKKVESGHRALYADGLNVHAMLMPRASFRKLVEGAVQQSFMHSFMTKGRLLYTHDESIADLFETLTAARAGQIGEHDTALQLLAAATSALGPIDKAHKWFLTRGDLDYSSLYILYAATNLAQIEVLEALKLVDREVIPQALAINPDFFKIIYSDLLNTKKTAKAVQAALDAIDRYLAERAPRLFAAVLDHLRETGDTRSATDIEHHFARTHGIECVTGACEYLADLGLIGKAAMTVQLTKKSNTDIQELAFFHLAQKQTQKQTQPQKSRRHGR
jgi:predicted nucleotidyltransferase